MKDCLVSTNLGSSRAAVDVRLVHLTGDKVLPRIWQRDHRVWKSAPDGIVNRLGWLDIAQRMSSRLQAFTEVASQVRGEGYTHALLLGMGGSSLAPECFRKTFGVAPGYLDLAVVDSTDPGAVLYWTERVDPSRTLWIVATKSGGTVETFSLMKFFHSWVTERLGRAEAGRHFVAVTDPGSKLEEVAADWNFRTTVLGDPEIGGRYSALSPFGLLPAALLGMDLETLLARAQKMAEACGPDVPAEQNPAAILGVTMAELARGGRDKLTLVLSEELGPSFGDWVEQLVAESTGKEGRGIVPVVGESLGSATSYGADRLFVGLSLQGDESCASRLEEIQRAGHPTVCVHLEDSYDLGGQIFLWELATAVAGHCLGINPFDQPDVESAKVAARAMLSEYKEKGEFPVESPTWADGLLSCYGDDQGAVGDTPLEALESFLSGLRPPTYVAIQAYVFPDLVTQTVLEDLRLRLSAELGVAVTLGFGPRFLHSTGQLHKGDAGHGRFLQITADDVRDVVIPDEMGFSQGVVSFGVLKAAQAMGDRQALRNAGRRVMRIHVGEERAAGLAMLGRVFAGPRSSTLPPP